LFVMDAAQREAVYKFFAANRTPGGMPLSYKVVPTNYWGSINHPADSIDAIIERLLVANSLNIYDGAIGQIAESILGHTDLADQHTARLLSGRSGDLADIRAVHDFTFNGKTIGDGQGQISPKNTWFFRMISDKYLQKDPLDGKTKFDGFPTWADLHHEDWKPIAGEQAWAAVIGPVQVAYAKYFDQIPFNAKEMTLAFSILPATEAMQSPIGAIYHAPTGTDGKDPADISNENNISMFAALRMLKEISDSYKDNDQAKQEVRRMNDMMFGKQTNRSGISGYLKNYAYDAEQGVFNQGGFYRGGRFIPTKTFAVDVQTWGIIVLGPGQIDEWYGEGTAYKIWKNTKKRAGYYDDKNILRGVGFSDGHDIFSGEWTFGAVMAARSLATYYETTHPDWANEALTDSVTMRNGIERELKVKFDDGSMAYLYANKRYEIPFGWWANPLPSLASTAWAVMVDTNFDPFVLGGGKNYQKTTKVQASEKLTAPTDPELTIAVKNMYGKGGDGYLTWYSIDPVQNVDQYEAIAVDIYPDSNYGKEFKVGIKVKGETFSHYDSEFFTVPQEKVKAGEIYTITIPMKDILPTLLERGEKPVIKEVHVGEGRIIFNKSGNINNDPKTVAPHAMVRFIPKKSTSQNGTTPQEKPSQSQPKEEKPQPKQLVSRDLMNEGRVGDYSGDGWASKTLEFDGVNLSGATSLNIGLTLKNGEAVIIQVLDEKHVAGVEGNEYRVDHVMGTQIFEIPLDKFGGVDWKAVNQIVIHYGKYYFGQPLNGDNTKLDLEKVEVKMPAKTSQSNGSMDKLFGSRITPPHNTLPPSVSLSLPATPRFLLNNFSLLIGLFAGASLTAISNGLMLGGVTMVILLTVYLAHRKKLLTSNNIPRILRLMSIRPLAVRLNDEGPWPSVGGAASLAAAALFSRIRGLVKKVRWVNVAGALVLGAALLQPTLVRAQDDPSVDRVAVLDIVIKENLAQAIAGLKELNSSDDVNRAGAYDGLLSDLQQLEESVTALPLPSPETVEEVAQEPEPVVSLPETVVIKENPVVEVSAIEDVVAAAPDAEVAAVEPAVVDVSTAEEAARATNEQAEAEQKAAAERAAQEAQAVQAERIAAEEQAAAQRAIEEQKEVARVAEEQRLADQRAAAEKEQADRIAAEAEAARLQADRIEKERVVAETVRLETERLAAENAVAEKAEVERIAAAKATAERKASEERAAAAEKARVEEEARKNREAEEAESHRLANEQRIAAETEAARLETERIEKERVAAETARLERVAAEKAAVERKAYEEAEALRLADEVERAAAERKAAEERSTAARAEALRAASEETEARQFAERMRLLAEDQAQQVAAENATHQQGHETTSVRIPLGFWIASIILLMLGFIQTFIDWKALITGELVRARRVKSPAIKPLPAMTELVDEPQPALSAIALLGGTLLAGGLIGGAVVFGLTVLPAQQLIKGARAIRRNVVKANAEAAAQAQAQRLAREQSRVEVESIPLLNTIALIGGVLLLGIIYGGAVGLGLLAISVRSVIRFFRTMNANQLARREAAAQANAQRVAEEQARLEAQLASAELAQREVAKEPQVRRQMDQRVSTQQPTAESTLTNPAVYPVEGRSGEDGALRDFMFVVVGFTAALGAVILLTLKGLGRIIKTSIHFVVKRFSLKAIIITISSIILIGAAIVFFPYLQAFAAGQFISPAVKVGLMKAGGLLAAASLLGIAFIRIRSFLRVRMFFKGMVRIPVGLIAMGLGTLLVTTIWGSAVILGLGALLVQQAIRLPSAIGRSLWAWMKTRVDRQPAVESPALTDEAKEGVDVTEDVQQSPEVALTPVKIVLIQWMNRATWAVIGIVGVVLIFSAFDITHLFQGGKLTSSNQTTLLFAFVGLLIAVITVPFVRQWIRDSRELRAAKAREQRASSGRALKGQNIFVSSARRQLARIALAVVGFRPSMPHISPRLRAIGLFLRDLAMPLLKRIVIVVAAIGAIGAAVIYGPELWNDPSLINKLLGINISNDLLSLLKPLIIPTIFLALGLYGWKRSRARARAAQSEESLEKEKVQFSFAAYRRDIWEFIKGLIPSRRMTAVSSAATRLIVGRKVREAGSFLRDLAGPLVKRIVIVVAAIGAVVAGLIYIPELLEDPSVMTNPLGRGHKDLLFNLVLISVPAAFVIFLLYQWRQNRKNEHAAEARQQTENEAIEGILSRIVIALRNGAVVQARGLADQINSQFFDSAYKRDILIFVERAIQAAADHAAALAAQATIAVESVRAPPSAEESLARQLDALLLDVRVAERNVKALEEDLALLEATVELRANAHQELEDIDLEKKLSRRLMSLVKREHRSPSSAINVQRANRWFRVARANVWRGRNDARAYKAVHQGFDLLANTKMRAGARDYLQEILGIIVQRTPAINKLVVSMNTIRESRLPQAKQQLAQAQAQILKLKGQAAEDQEIQEQAPQPSQPVNEKVASSIAGRIIIALLIVLIGSVILLTSCQAVPVDGSSSDIWNVSLVGAIVVIFFVSVLMGFVRALRQNVHYSRAKMMRIGTGIKIGVIILSLGFMIWLFSAAAKGQQDPDVKAPAVQAQQLQKENPLAAYAIQQSFSRTISSIDALVNDFQAEGYAHADSIREMFDDFKARSSRGQNDVFIDFGGVISAKMITGSDGVRYLALDIDYFQKMIDEAGRLGPQRPDLKHNLQIYMKSILVKENFHYRNDFSYKIDLFNNYSLFQKNADPDDLLELARATMASHIDLEVQGFAANAEYLWTQGLTDAALRELSEHTTGKVSQNIARKEKDFATLNIS
ncbi:MAG: hypothetical protein Q7S13_00225, partial [Candidatus Omnitrophota bacterium]|nr:hypothetical protein [Candidatus Omnitrophota bacterium]